MDLKEFNTISSARIAKLTNKRLFNIHRDIREILSQLDDSNLNDLFYKEVKDNRGYTKEFILGETLALVLATGYNVHLRLKLVKEMQKLRSENLSLKDKILKMELEQRKDKIKDLTNALHLHRYDMNGKDWDLEEPFVNYTL